MSPLVGLSAYRERTRFGVWDITADVLATVYADAVVAAGGLPVLLPVGPPEHGARVVDRLDALVVSGGPDVSPERYGEKRHPRTAEPRDTRDAWELALFDAAEARALPTLGVCRGMQLMAVRAGGALLQHLPDEVGHDEHSPGGDAFAENVVRIEPDSMLHRLEGERTVVHCHHHQAVVAHPGFRPVAWAADGTLEAMEKVGDRFYVGVQWHPEMKEDAGLFSGLVEAARSGSGAA